MTKRRIGQRKGQRKRSAKKGWTTRRAKQRKAAKQARQRAARRDEELRRIETLLGEDFETLAEARRALKTETSLPSPEDLPEITTVESYEHFYQQYDAIDYDFEDQGEVDAGVDY